MLTALGLTSLDQFVGESISKWDVPNEARWLYCKQAMDAKQEIIVEETYQDLYFLSTRKPIMRDGQIQGILGISIDITDRKKMQKSYIALEAAEAANRAKDAFMINMAHDIRTPLTGMIHMSEDLTEMVAADEEASLRAQLLFQSSKRLLTLLESVLELSKAEQIRADDIKKEPVNLREMIKQLNELLLPSIKEKGEGSGVCILLIEDDPSARLGAQSCLKRAGYQVITVDNVANALQCLKEQHFDLILSDIGLPDGDGMEFTRKYRHWEKQNNKPYTPIVALTGHAIETVKENCVASGMDEVFKKPLGKDALEILAKILEGAKGT